MVRAVTLAQPWGVEFRAGEHACRADTEKAGVGGTAGMRPHELLEGALASCVAITARMALADLGVPDARVEVRVEVVRDQDLTTFQYDVVLDATVECHREYVMARVAASPVRTTLSKPLAFHPVSPAVG